MQRSDGAPYARCAAEIRLLPLRATDVFETDVPSVGDNILFGSSPTLERERLAYHLVDAANGRSLATFKSLWNGVFRSAVVSRTGGNEEELLDLANGGILEPKITTPDGPGTKWRIALDGRDGKVWLLARTKRKTQYYGAWPEPRSANVELHQPLPFWPEFVEDGDSVIVSNAELSCRLGDQPRCFPAYPYLVSIGGRYAVGMQTDHIYDIELERAATLDAGCTWRTSAVLVEPPRVLLACDTEDQVRWAVWTPTGIESRWASPKDLWPMSFTRNTRIVPLERLARPDAAVSHWFDLLTGQVVTTPALVPLQLQGSFGTRILVQPDGAPSELLLLDLEQRSLTSIARDLDCEEYLSWDAASDARIVVDCPKPSMAGNEFRPGIRLRHYQWLEVIDVATHRRLRTEQVFEAKLTQSGRAIGTRPGAVAQLAGLEWPATCAP